MALKMHDLLLAARVSALFAVQRHHPLLWSSELQGQLCGSPMLRVLSDRLKQVAEVSQPAPGRQDTRAAFKQPQTAPHRHSHWQGPGKCYFCGSG